MKESRDELNKKIREMQRKIDNLDMAYEESQNKLNE